MKRHALFALLPTYIVASMAWAQAPCSLTVDKGSFVTVTVQITVDSLFGNQADTDTLTVGVSGFGNGTLSPSSEPFNAVELTEIEYQVEDGTLNYEFFCVPIFGCQEIEVFAPNLTLSLAEAASSSLDSNDSASFDSLWNMHLEYEIQGSLFELTGVADETEPAVFGCTFTFKDGDAAVSDLNLAPILGEIPADKLPVGIYSVLLLTTVDLSQASMSGTYETGDGVEGDLNGDGLVNGADLGILLSQFGGPGSADFDGDDTVNGGDLGLMLIYWTG
jgi:hypothetical protein